jgi:hypothetical protein
MIFRGIFCGERPPSVVVTPWSTLLMLVWQFRLLPDWRAKDKEKIWREKGRSLKLARDMQFRVKNSDIFQRHIRNRF